MALGAGARLGHYEIRSKIGEGGMGEVYLAEDTRLGRKVALKILPAEAAADRERMQRFRQEARAASALNHPNILTIYEIEQSDSKSFIATEFIEGETLRQRMQREPIKPSEALDVAVQTASALGAAHAAGIAHRDIKPENIMLRRDGIVKVLDFGLAKLTEPASPLSTDTEAPTRAAVITEPGVVLGTALYMSPEQARGLTVDSRTDVFSLGVVVYEMVTGRLPFAGANRNEVLASILSEKESLPLARYAREVPAELERIVEKALRKDREQRYQTIKDMLLDLQTLQRRLEFKAELERSQPPETIRGSGTTDVTGVGPAAATAERRPRRLGGMIVLAVLLLAAAGFGYFLYFAKAAHAIDSIAVMPFVNESGNPDAEYLSDGITESLIDSLSQVSGLNIKARSSAVRYKGKDISPQTVGKELGVQAILNGRVVQHGDDLALYLSLVSATSENQLWGKQYVQKVNNLVTLQQEIARDVTENLKTKLTRAGEQKLTKSYTANSEAYRIYLQGRYFWNKRTPSDLRKSIGYFKQAVALDPKYALAYTGLADAYSNLAIPFFGIRPGKLFPLAKEAALRALEIDNTLAEAHVSLGFVKERYDWDWVAAEREYKRAIDLNADYPTAHHRYGVFLASIGRIDESIAELKRARELDPLSLIIATDSSLPYFWSARYEQAVEVLQKAIEMDPSFARAHFHLGHNYREMGRYEEAIAEHKKYFALAGRQYWDDGTRNINAFLAVDYAAAGRKYEAQRMLDEMAEQEKQGEYTYSFPRALVYAELGDKEQAFVWLEKAYRERFPAMFELRVAPGFDKIRDDPRFADLVRRVGLPQ
jgi:serine/threonine-protein kinase